MILRLQFALGMRPEEVTAARWSGLARPTPEGDWMLSIDAALSHGRVAGVKTIERSKRVPAIVYEWLTAWRDVAAAHGLPTAPEDFIIPGAARDGHFTFNQHKKWAGKYFRPAAAAVRGAIRTRVSGQGDVVIDAAESGHRLAAFDQQLITASKPERLTTGS
jgi:hypothetical protein